MICGSVTFSGFQSEKDLELNKIIVFFLCAESDFIIVCGFLCTVYTVCLPVRGSEGGVSGAAAPSCRVKMAAKWVL